MFFRRRKTLFLNRNRNNSDIEKRDADPDVTKSMAEKAYELTDDDFHDGIKEKLSTFRKKRLAEKTYEFKDEDSENVTPLPRLRSQVVESATSSDSSGLLSNEAKITMKSPRPSDSDESSVLRPIMENQFASSPSDVIKSGPSTDNAETPQCCSTKGKTA